MGNESYNEFFGKDINYTSIQNSNNTKTIYNITSIKIRFFEAILIICNSFQVLALLKDDQVIFLNKAAYDPFYLVIFNFSIIKGIIILEN